ncbi:hypothetical protein CDL62_14875 [Alkalitalea saponilacus]|nr:hypothetical protein CDL62_14875 [Alkalitalea saponilacus]
MSFKIHSSRKFYIIIDFQSSAIFFQTSDSEKFNALKIKSSNFSTIGYSGDIDPLEPEDFSFLLKVQRT